MNPSDSLVSTGQSAGVAPSNRINDPNFRNHQGSNTFDLSFQNLLTARYGEITPFFYMNGIGRDRLTLRSSHDLRTYTLGAPLMSALRMRKSIFSVPMKSIMPNSYNYLFVNPVKGDDVPDDAYCGIDLAKLLFYLCDGISTYIPSATTAAKAGFVLKRFLLINSIFSAGSLLDYVGCSTNRWLVRKSLDVDGTFDALVEAAITAKPSIKYILNNPADGSERSTTFSVSDRSTARELLFLIMQHPDCEITSPADYGWILSTLTDFFTIATSTLTIDDSYVVNIERVVAYQQIASQFFTNDHVDNIYSSALWMDNQYGLISQLWKSTTPDPYYFDYNGVSVRYDTFSQHILDRAASNLVADATYTNGLKIMYFFFNLFTYRRSLRYGDYFLASRPQPLAVGDVNVPVTGDNVSVIDINKNLHIQRFLNAVNRVGSAVTDYARGIFGYTPKEDDARPRFISSETLFVGSDEIDNTANDQGKVNTNLIAQQSNYMFDVNISDDCVILGLITFEATSAYKNMVERDFYHLTRYDNFIPELQHLGDQKVYGSELSGEPAYKDTTFGYQVRYAEYKFKVNQAHGGFCTNALKQWFFPALDEVGSYIDEDAIRSRPMDFDPYYKSLTGANMADYFHFQISFANNVRGNRAMDYEPTLL